jgi:hypothetical protein
VTIHPRRSVLYMPGSNARAIEKAKSLADDAVRAIEERGGQRLRPLNRPRCA